MNRLVVVGGIVVVVVIILIVAFILTRRSGTSKPEAPTFISTVAWQGNNPNNVGGLVWQTPGTAPWNKYYKFSCIKDGVESDLSDAVGPVANGLFKFPTMYMSEKPCNGNRVRIYRSDSATGTFTPMNMSSFAGGAPYDGTARYFVDLNP